MGNILHQGIAAYQKTMRPPTISPESEPPQKDNTKVPLGNEINGLRKTVKPPVSPALPMSSLPVTPPIPLEESKTRRVAKLLILIGSSQAAKILCELDPEQVEEISREIATVKAIGPDEARVILAEFESLLFSPYNYLQTSSGGVDAARNILYAAYGPEKGEALLNKTIPESKENIFGFLEEFNSEQLVFLLKDESPVTVALVLARLPAKISAETLGQFPPALKPEILKKIAHQSEVSPEILERVAGAIMEKARLLGSRDSQDVAIDGMQTLAAILKQGDYSFGDRIINELEVENPDIGKDLKERIYTLDDVLIVADRALAEKLRSMQERTIAILLKGRSGEFSEKILSNVSSGRREMIREESEILGAVSKRDHEAVAGDFMAWFRLARENGELLLSTDKDWVE